MVFEEKVNMETLAICSHVPYGFLMSSGGRERVRWEQMS